MTRDVDSDKWDSLISDRSVWHVQFREDEETPWKSIGTHREEWPDVLRIYEDGLTRYPAHESRIVRTEVRDYVEDPQKLRDLLAEKTAQEELSALQSD